MENVYETEKAIIRSYQFRLTYSQCIIIIKDFQEKDLPKEKE